ncbi:hypothetical protein C7G41_21255 [Bradyrhizobium sp. MOS002]|nr:hypothetical protein C7G41_21255 [Bradyrhizobium sp. MOS002]
MSVRWVLANILRDELSSRGIRSLSDDEYKEIAGAIFARIAEFELELAAIDFGPPRRPTRQ